MALTNEKGGYRGHSMSNRAVKAYDRGEMPISKWTKKVLLEELAEVAYDNDIAFENVALNRLTLKELQAAFLENSSRHHTGAFYSTTNFYSIAEDAASRMNKEYVERIISARPKKSAKTEEKKAAEDKKKEVKSQAAAVYDKLHIIYTVGTTGLKTQRGVVKRWTSGIMDLDAEYAKTVELVRKNDAAKVNGWRKLPATHWRQRFVADFDNDIDRYIEKMYGIGDKKRNRSLMADIERKITL
nr:MAG TPA: hypothetical protein [Caudoviricetes sp.]